MRRYRHRRLAFTLVEMLVVIAIILIVTAIGVMALPSSQDRTMQSAADQLQGWLLIAKQRAKREDRPTGLRIMVDPTSNQATQCYYVYQPDDLRLDGTFCTGVGSTTVTFADVVPVATPAGPFKADAFQSVGCQIGDYLEVYHGGGVYQITAAPQQQPVVPVPGGFIRPWVLTVGGTGPNALVNGNTMVQEYRIRRQPVLLPGEDVLNLPDGVAIDNGILDAAAATPFGVTPTNKAKCLTLPPGMSITTSTGTFTAYDILFSPQGGLVGRGTGSAGLCVLWVSNTKNNSTFPLMLVIQAHTGFIAVQATNTVQKAGTVDAYAHCRDIRASGL